MPQPEAPVPNPDRAESWGHPAFARDYPRQPELDALVDAFARGDYRTVRSQAPLLAARADVSPEVQTAALELRRRIEPERHAVLLFVFAGALMVFLFSWWLTHDGGR